MGAASTKSSLLFLGDLQSWSFTGLLEFCQEMEIIQRDIVGEEYRDCGEFRLAGAIGAAIRRDELQIA